MKCNKKDCKWCCTFQNSEDCGLCICSFDDNYIQVKYDGECVYGTKKLTCGDCWHYVEGDTACMTAEENDEVGNCPGFEDATKYQIDNLLFRKFCCGYTKEMLLDILEQCKRAVTEDFKTPWEEEENGNEK